MMRTPRSGYRWFVIAVFFCFMLLHQSDKLLIGPLTPAIMDEFGISMTQMGAVTTGALVVASILYPIWGYLYDRFSRARLLALASFIWGSTTWLSAVARTYPTFLMARASTGIDDSSYPGMYALVADYFGPNLRGKVYGLLQLAQPIGYLVGMVLALMLAPQIGWRTIFFLTGGLGIVVAVVILFGVREMPRGKAEPEFEGMTEMARFPLLVGGNACCAGEAHHVVRLPARVRRRLSVECDHLLVLHLSGARARLRRRKHSADGRASYSDPGERQFYWRRSG
jgi:MFS family permease